MHFAEYLEEPGGMANLPHVYVHHNSYRLFYRFGPRARFVSKLIGFTGACPTSRTMKRAKTPITVLILDTMAARTVAPVVPCLHANRAYPHGNKASRDPQGRIGAGNRGG